MIGRQNVRPPKERIEYLRDFMEVPNTEFTPTEMKEVFDALDQADQALREIREHHKALNARVGRPVDHSKTIRLATHGLGEAP